MISLDEILQMLTAGELYDFGKTEYNENGEKAYNKLVKLLYDVQILTCRNNIHDIIEVLDNIHDE